MARKEDIGRRLEGGKNHVYWLPTPHGPVVARRRKTPFQALADHMLHKTYDVLPRLVPHTAWAAAARHTDVVPPVLHAGPEWLVVAGVAGRNGEPAETAPENLADWSDEFVDTFAAAVGKLTAIPKSSVMHPQAAPETDMNRYMRRYVEYVRERCLIDERRKEYDALGRGLGFPLKVSEFLDAFKDGWAPVGFGVQHFDLHPGNTLVGVFFVDIDGARWAPHGSDLSRLPNMLRSEPDAQVLPKAMARMAKAYGPSIPEKDRDGFEANWAPLCAFDLLRSIGIQMHLTFQKADAPLAAYRDRYKKEAGKRYREELLAGSATLMCGAVNKARAMLWQQPPITLAAVAERLAPMFGVRVPPDDLIFNSRLVDRRITQGLPALDRGRPQALPSTAHPGTGLRDGDYAPGTRGIARSLDLGLSRER